ncbi:DegT/DnrJ/EryC1/StrS family aminotransferase [Paenibacillus sp. 1P03SA]|uniref:DegT/DnrJ/EryC1/StrS family aminotransferase n=1 Tax=Paenibacillus sp. 1P03SA TaxID=3132294 RepID=UPI0039A076D3
MNSRELHVLPESILVTKSFLPPIEEYIGEIERIWSSHWLTNNGIIHSDFEKKLKEYLGVPNISLFTNGHLALETALKNLGLKGEVITTPFTFASTTHAILNSGLTPVFCDIEEVTFNMDANKIETLITENTSAIVPVHVFGNPCDVDKIESIASKYNLKVIYDAAHAFGVETKGTPIGNFGDVSMFSMHATKVFHSIEGGILSTSNHNYKKRFDLFKNFGISGPESLETRGINAKMNEFQAAMGLVNLRYIEQEIEQRKQLTQIYRELLKNIKGIRYLDDISQVKHNYSYFPIIVDKEQYGKDRDFLHDELRKCNVFTRKYFYPLTTEIQAIQNLGLNNDLPVAKKIASSVLTLPIYTSLETDYIRKICHNISLIGEGC